MENPRFYRRLQVYHRLPYKKPIYPHDFFCYVKTIVQKYASCAKTFFICEHSVNQSLQA